MAFYYIDTEHIPSHAFDTWVRVIPSYDRVKYHPEIKEKYISLLTSSWDELTESQKINSIPLLSSWLFSGDDDIRDQLVALPIQKEWIVRSCFALAEDVDDIFRWFQMSSIGPCDVSSWLKSNTECFSLFFNPRIMEYVSNMDRKESVRHYFSQVAGNLENNTKSISHFLKYANIEDIQYLATHLSGDKEPFLRELIFSMYESAIRKNVNADNDRQQYLNICYLADHVFAEYSHYFKKMPQALGLKMAVSVDWFQEYPTLKNEYLNALGLIDQLSSTERFSLLKSIPEVWPYLHQEEQSSVRSFFESYMATYSGEFLESSMNISETCGFLGSMNAELITMGIRILEKNKMYTLGVHRIPEKIVCRWWEQHRLGMEFTEDQRQALGKYMSLMFNPGTARAAIAGRIQAAYASSPDIMLFWQEQDAWKRFVQGGDFLALMNKKDLWYMNGYNKSLINRCMDELFGDALSIDFADTYVDYMDKEHFRALDDIRKISVVLFGEESLIYFDLQRNDSNEVAWEDFYAYARTRLVMNTTECENTNIGAIYV